MEDALSSPSVISNIHTKSLILYENTSNAAIWEKTPDICKRDSLTMGKNDGDNSSPSSEEGELSRRNFVNWLAEYPMLCKKIRIFAENSFHEEPLVYPIAPVHFLRRECLECAGDKRETTPAVFL
ncbi:MAG: hypothetical protein J6Y35_05920 [Bacteroidales bacterium]|nr:hypothetical protein [Bacteroidales bacterium]